MSDQISAINQVSNAFQAGAKGAIQAQIENVTKSLSLAGQLSKEETEFKMACAQFTSKAKQKDEAIQTMKQVLAG